MVDLFSPITLGPYELPNRIVMAPMTRNRATKDGVPQAINALYYAQRASAGLIITEASPISPQGIGYPNTPGIYQQDQVTGWRKVTKAVHENGGRIFLQLWHVGRVSHPSMQPNQALPVAPSAIKPEGEAFTYEGLQAFVTPRALETEEIPGIVEQYRQAAAKALEAEFDGVEIHAANGYLIDQFLRDGTNHRNDQYGGSLENRARLLLEVIEAVTGVWDTDRVGVRLSPLNPFNSMFDSDPETLFSYVVKQLNPLHLAYLHIVEGAIGVSGNAGPAFKMSKLREQYRGLYMANSGYDKTRANEALQNGRSDFISFGILFLANPDLPTRLAQNTPLNTLDQATFYGGNEKGYTDYPTLKESTEQK